MSRFSVFFLGANKLIVCTRLSLITMFSISYSQLNLKKKIVFNHIKMMIEESVIDVEWYCQFLDFEWFIIGIILVATCWKSHYWVKFIRKNYFHCIEWFLCPWMKKKRMFYFQFLYKINKSQWRYIEWAAVRNTFSSPEKKISL